MWDIAVYLTLRLLSFDTACGEADPATRKAGKGRLMTVEEAAVSVAQSQEMFAGAEALRRMQRYHEAINGDDRASEAQFSRAFKERFGMAPRELRSVARERGVNMLPPTTVGVAPDSVQRLGR